MLSDFEYKLLLEIAEGRRERISDFTRRERRALRKMEKRGLVQKIPEESPNEMREAPAGDWRELLEQRRERRWRHMVFVSVTSILVSLVSIGLTIARWLG